MRRPPAVKVSPAFAPELLPRTVYRTLYRFEDLGEDALLDQRQQRPPSKVTAEVEQHLVGYIDRSPQDFGWQRTTWTLVRPCPVSR